MVVAKSSRPSPGECELGRQKDLDHLTSHTSPQRQTYAPFTNTRTQAVLAAAAPKAAPPTTARRVVRRATPATLTGVAGRPTLACAVSMDSEGPLFFDHSTDPNVPHARTTATINVRLALIFFIETSIVKTTMLPATRRPLIYINPRIRKNGVHLSLKLQFRRR
jgi:hypothetical protein